MENRCSTCGHHARDHAGYYAQCAQCDGCLRYEEVAQEDAPSLPSESFLPRLTVPDARDARIIFDALNTVYWDIKSEDKTRHAELLIAAHAELMRAEAHAGTTVQP